VRLECVGGGGRGKDEDVLVELLVGGWGAEGDDCRRVLVDWLVGAWWKLTALKSGCVWRFG
jgi:hypothetical protein